MGIPNNPDKIHHDNTAKVFEDRIKETSWRSKKAPTVVATLVVLEEL